MSAFFPEAKYHSCKIAFAVPDKVSHDDCDRLYTRICTQYKDVALYHASICSGPILEFEFPDIPTPAQIERIERQITCLIP